MSTQLAVLDSPPLYPSVIGLDIEEAQAGIGFARKRKPGWRQRLDEAAALGIGAGVVIVRKAMGEQRADKELAAAAIRERDALQARVDEIEATLRHRAVPMLDHLPDLKVAGAKANRTRWTDAERAALADELEARPGPRPGYLAIANKLGERFPNRTFTAASVGAQARKLRGKR
jgi:hypothetical protein